MVAFDSQVIDYLVIPNGATTGARIVLDGTTGTILIYNAANVLIATIAPQPGTDPSGQGYNTGFQSFDPADRKHYAQLVNGAVVLNIDNPPEVLGAILQALAAQGPGGDQPGLLITSPLNNVASAALELFGDNVSPGTELPYARFGINGLAVDMNVLIGGQLKYSPPSSLGAGAEMWHNILPQTNWSNLGAPWGDPKYQRTATGTVRFSGAIQWTDGVTAAPVTIFTLPVGYRPDRQVRMSVITMTGDGVTPQVEGLTITTAGVVQLTNYPAGGPNTPISLEGLEFDLTSAP